MWRALSPLRGSFSQRTATHGLRHGLDILSPLRGFAFRESCAVPGGLGSSNVHFPGTPVPGYHISPVRGWVIKYSQLLRLPRRFY
jgi:hypothetical protein